MIFSAKKRSGKKLKKLFKPKRNTKRFWLRKSSLLVFVLVFAAIGSYFIFASHADSYDSSFEDDQFNKINATRNANGLPSLARSNCLNQAARDWTFTMAASKKVFHSDAVYGDIKVIIEKYCGAGWNGLAENVGQALSSDQMFSAFMNSAPHRANILGNYSKIGIGVFRIDNYCDGSGWCGTTYFETQHFGISDNPNWASNPTPTYQGRLDTFVKGTDNQLWHKWYDGYNWSANWEPLGGSLASGPGTSSQGNGKLDIFARNSSGYLIHKWYDGAGWHGWETFTEATIASDPDSVSWGNGRVDVVARSPSNRVMHKWYDNGKWYNWEIFNDINIASSPTIASWGPGKLDVFVRGTDSHLYTKWYVNNTWSGPGWALLGGTTYDSPDAVSWGLGRIDLFVRGTDNQLYTKWYAGGWSGWVQIPGGAMASGPSVASRKPGSLDVFVKGTDNQIYTRWFSGSWSDWTLLNNGTTYDAPDAVSWH